jgi:hypothetical protein
MRPWEPSRRPEAREGNLDEMADETMPKLLKIYSKRNLSRL